MRLSAGHRLIVLRLVVLSFLMSGCGLRHLLPEGPAATPEEHREIWTSKAQAQVTYRGEARVDLPVLPFMPFGVAYDVDIVIVSEHPDWNMHEYARLATPSGPIWLAKDAREPRLEQSIVASIPDIDSWLPEVPVRRKSDDLIITDRSTDDWLDVEIGYENMAGEPVLMSYQGRMPVSLQKKRNGSTLGHSRDHLMVVLDLSHRNFGKKASMVINGKKVKVERILGLVPFQMALQQVQGGLGVGEYALSVADGKLASTHQGLDGAKTVQTWSIDSGADELVVRQESEIRTLSYFFRRNGAALELYRMQASQWGRENSPFEMHFAPALPDPRFAFDGVASSRFVMDVNGQLGHGIGSVTVTSREDGAHFAVVPERPTWIADRPLESLIRFEQDSNASVLIQRVDVGE